MKNLSMTSGLSTLASAAGLAVGLVGLALPAGEAQGQVFRAIRAGAVGDAGPEVSKARIEKYATALKLDESQKAALLAMHEGYQERMSDANKVQEEAMKKLSKSAKDGDHTAFMEEMPKIMKEFTTKRNEATKALLTDMRGLLTAEQSGRWDTVERMRRRESGLMMGSVSGSGVDLVDLVDSLKMPADVRGKVTGVLGEYETEMDAVLREKAKAEEEVSKKSEKENGGAPGLVITVDMDAMHKQMDDERRVGIKVRDVNKRYVRRMDAELPEDWRKKLDKEFTTRAFRRIYKDSQTMIQLKEALKFSDLSADQKRQVTDLMSRYEKESESLNSRWASALEKAENDGKAGTGLLVGLPGMDSDEDEGLKSARQARQDLDKTFGEQLRGMLSEEQRKRLPAKKGGDNGFFVGPDGVDGDVEIESDDGGHTTLRVRVNGPGGGE